MKKINCFFTCFFLIFLILSAVPTVISSANWQKRYWLRLHDKIMKKYSTRVYAPRRRLGSPYRGSPAGSAAKLPSSCKKSGRLEPFFDFIRELLPEQKAFENYLIAMFPLREHFSEFNMAVKRMAGMKQPVEYQPSVLLPDHSLCKIIWQERTRPEDVLAYQKASREVNAEFFYLVRPISTSSVNGTYEIYPGLFDYVNQHISDSIKLLEKMQIPYLDLRVCMGQFTQNAEFKKFFFKGDHHWKVDGALLAAKLTAAYMNRHCGTKYDLRFFDPDIFHRVRYKDIFIGSQGRQLSLAYLSGKEDFDILYPDYKTDFTFENSSRMFSVRGNFSILLFQKYNHHNSYHTDSYAAFMRGFHGDSRITNHLIDRKHGKKLLIINDSFARAMAPYLALQTREIVLLEPRTIECKDIVKYIRREKPDIVFDMFLLNVQDPIWMKPIWNSSGKK